MIINSIINIFLTLTLFGFLTNVDGDIEQFASDYKFEISNAEDYYKSLEPEFILQSKKYGTDHKFISALVFPELIRYSVYRDFFETTVLEYFYVQNGSKSANFSIGMFQIKPSFVEQLEKELKNNDKLKKYSSIIKYKATTPEDIRNERLNRIKSKTWQIKYLNCFYDMINLKFNTIRFNTKEEKLLFYATAYNHGFNCTKEEIYKWGKVKSFPMGDVTNEEYFNYSEISLYFYKKLKLIKNE